MPWKNFVTQPFKNAQYKHMLPPPEPEAGPQNHHGAPGAASQAAPKAPAHKARPAEAPPAKAPAEAPPAPGLCQPELEPSQAAPADANPGAPTQDDLAQEAQAEPSQAAPAEAGPGAPTQAAPPQGYASYCISALAEIDPENAISDFITLINSQEENGIQNFGDETQLAWLQSLVSENHQLLQDALDSQKRTIAQLQEAISTMLSEQDWMASMQAELDTFSVKVESVLAQMQKERKAAQLAEMRRLAEAQLMLEKQAKAGDIVKIMKENCLSVEDLNQFLSLTNQKRKVAEPSMLAEPAEKRLRMTKEP